MSSDREFNSQELDDYVPDELRSKESMIQPFDWYQKKRSEGAIQYDESRDVYDVFGYDTAKTILQNDDQFLRHDLRGGHGNTVENDPLSYLDNAMMWSDGDTHNRVKGDLFELFSPARMGEMRSVIESVTEAELRYFTVDSRQFDFAREFAVPVSLKITMNILGVPEEDYDKVHGWITELSDIKRSEYYSDSSDSPNDSTGAVEYMKKLIKEREKEPQDDMITAMLDSTDLDYDEVGSNCIDVMVASTGTMADFLSDTLYLLSQHNLFYEDVFSEFPDIVEEVARYRSPIQAQLRVAGGEVTVNGNGLEQGSEIVIWFGAANRDPDQFENPNEFVPDRDPDHLGFGTGAHACIGAPLARFEIPTILTVVMASIQGVEVIDESVAPNPSASSLGFARLPVSFVMRE